MTTLRLQNMAALESGRSIARLLFRIVLRPADDRFMLRSDLIFA